MIELLKNPVVRGALAGAITALWTDYRVFVTWKTFHDFVTYDYRAMTVRVIQGAIAGALTGAGISSVS